MELSPLRCTFHHMKPLLLLLAILTAHAADLEQITLSDGRHLVGVYDDIAGTVTLDGPGAAVIKIRPEQVKAREAYVKADPATANEKAPAAPRENRNESPDVRLAKARAEAERLRNKAESIELDAIVEFLQSADLSQQPVSELKSDPRKSEVEQHRRALQVNAERQAFSKLLSDAKLLKSDPLTPHGFEARDILYRMKELEEKAKVSAEGAEKRAAKIK